MGFLKVVELGLRRHRSPEDYLAMQEYLASGTVAELERYGVDLAECDVLELGAGRGGYSSVLFKLSKSFLASDLYPNPIFAEGAIPFRKFDACEPFPLEPESFDLIYCSSLIEHLASPEKMLTQCRRMLRPHGTLFISFPPFYSLAMVGGHHFKPYHLLGERLGLFLHNKLRNANVTSYANCYGNFGLHPLTIDRVGRMIGEAGFRVSSVYTRMLPINTCRLLGTLKDLATWHACFLARPA